MDYWFRVEVGDGRNPYLHLHGEMAFTDDEVDAVRDALRKAGGAWAGPKQTQVDTKRKNPDTGWVSYAMGSDVEGTQRRILRDRDAPHEPSWRDARFFIGKNLKRLAKSLYEYARPKLPIKMISWQKACDLES